MSTDIPDLIAGALGVSRGTAYDMMRETLAEQPVPKTPLTVIVDELQESKKAIAACGALTPEQRHQINKPILEAQIFFRAAARMFAEKDALAEQPAQQQNEADELIRNLGFDPEQFRTEAGFINHMRLRAAIKHPDEYHASMQPMYQKLTNCVACGRLNPTKGICNHGAEPPAQQEPVGSLSVRYFRGCKSMTNTDFDYYGDLPEGDYELYASPPARKPLSNFAKAAIYAKHFGNPVPDAWYAAINDLEAAHGIKGDA